MRKVLFCHPQWGGGVIKALQWVQKAAVCWGTRRSLKLAWHPTGDWPALEGSVYHGHILQAPLQPHEHTLRPSRWASLALLVPHTVAECDVHSIYKSNQAFKPNFQFIENTGNKGIS